MPRNEHKIFSISCQKGYLPKEKLFSPFCLATICFCRDSCGVERTWHHASPSGGDSCITLRYLGVFWGNVFIFHQKNFHMSPHGEWENVGRFANTASNSIRWEISFPGKDTVPANGWAGIPQKPHLLREVPACSSQKCLRQTSNLPPSSNVGVSRKEREKLLQLF